MTFLLWVVLSLLNQALENWSWGRWSLPVLEGVGIYLARYNLRRRIAELV